MTDGRIEDKQGPDRSETDEGIDLGVRPTKVQCGQAEFDECQRRETQQHTAATQNATPRQRRLLAAPRGNACRSGWAVSRTAGGGGPGCRVSMHPIVDRFHGGCKQRWFPFWRQTW